MHLLSTGTSPICGVPRRQCQITVLLDGRDVSLLAVEACDRLPCDHCDGTCEVEVPLEDGNYMACPVCLGSGSKRFGFVELLYKTVLPDGRLQTLVDYEEDRLPTYTAFGKVEIKVYGPSPLTRYPGPYQRGT
jgi:hypothetical protein